MKRKCPMRHFRKCPENRDKCAWWDWETKDCAITVISDGILDIHDTLRQKWLYIPLGDVHFGSKNDE